MKKISILLGALLSLNAYAHEHHVPLTLKDCIIQESIADGKITGAYFTLIQEDDEARQLIKAEVNTLTDHVEIHEMAHENGKMIMREIESYPVEKGENYFKKGGHHLMLMELQQSAKAGDSHELTLYFDDESQLSCQAQVLSVEEVIAHFQNDGETHHHHHHHHH